MWLNKNNKKKIRKKIKHFSFHRLGEGLGGVVYSQFNYPPPVNFCSGLFLIINIKYYNMLFWIEK